ncbi:MAG TPA: hypothetical protein DCX96_04740 [Oscillibacter sp.]|nr:hypothetical protein [Oscillibacter sp.]
MDFFDKLKRAAFGRLFLSLPPKFFALFHRNPQIFPPIPLDASLRLCYNFKLRGIRPRDLLCDDRRRAPVPGELASRDRVVGLKQTRRAVMQGAARAVYLASDADPRLTEPLRELCRAQDVPCDGSMTLQQLGRACGIAVPAAAVAVLNG